MSRAGRASSVRTWLSLVVFVGIVALIDYMLLDYLVSHGLEQKFQSISIGTFQLSIPIITLTFVGVLIVAIAAWHNISRTMPITALREMSQLETARMLRAAGLALFFFSSALFTPYIMGASGFWVQVSSLSKSTPQLAGSFQGLYSAMQPVMALDAVAKLAISQNLAAAALVLVSGLISHYQRRVRRTK